MNSSLVFSALLLGLGASTASATVNLVFGPGITFATNWADGAGAANSTLAWGIVVDSAGNGFGANGAGYRFGANITTGQQTLMTPSDTVSDDVLYVSPTLMQLVTTPIDGATSGQNRIASFNGLSMTGDVGAGDSFAIIWFDRTFLNNNPAGIDEKYGLFTNASFTLPLDTTSGDYTSIFAGADPLKQMNHAFIVPEPSSLLLGLVGIAGFLRRRR